MSVTAKALFRTSTDAEELRTFLTEEIRVAGNVRRHFDEDKLRELADSIAQYGIIEPLVVRRGDDGGYELIAGERRLRAAKILGLAMVPVRVMDVTAAEAAEMQLVENLQRQDLSPVEEAQGLQELMKHANLSQKELAAKIGKSQPYVANRLYLLRLPEKMLDQVQGGALSPAHAMELRKLDGHPDWMEELATTVVDENLSVASTSKHVDDMIAEHLLPVHDGIWFSNGREKPLFEVGPCQNCKSVIRAVSMYWGKKHPYCDKPECWNEKQKAAKANLVEAAGNQVDTSKLAYGSYAYFGHGKLEGLWEQCTNCDKRRQRVEYGDWICLDVKCHQKTMLKETKERNKLARARHAEELKGIREAAGIVAVRAADGVEHAFLVYAAALALGAVVPQYWSDNVDKRPGLRQYAATAKGMEDAGEDLIWVSWILRSGPIWDKQAKRNVEKFLARLDSLSDVELVQIAVEYPAVAQGLSPLSRWIMGIEEPQDKEEQGSEMLEQPSEDTEEDQED